MINMEYPCAKCIAYLHYKKYRQEKYKDGDPNCVEFDESGEPIFTREIRYAEDLACLVFDLEEMLRELKYDNVNIKNKYEGAKEYIDYLECKLDDAEIYFSQENWD